MESLPPQPQTARRGWSLLQGVLLALLLAGTVWVAWAAFRLVPFWTWSAARLAASARLALDFPLYPPPGDGMVTGWVYGPVSAIAYLPAIGAGEPLAALQVAGWLNAGYFLFPIGALGALARVKLHARTDLGTLVGFGAAAWLLPYSTWYGAAALGADTVAICLGALSCLVLAKSGPLPLAAGLSVMAAWTKQPEALLGVAQVAYLAGTAGRRVAWSYVAWLVAWAGGTALFFGTWFGWEGLWHGMITVPSRHPIETGRLPGLLWSWWVSTWWVWLLFPATRWLASGQRGGRPDVLRRSGDLLTLASLGLLPGGLAAAAKVGGDQNSLHAIAYATLGGVAWFAGLLGDDRGPVARTARLGLFGMWALLIGLGLQRVAGHGHFAIREPGAQHRAAFEFARARPGQVYFPCNPLITLLAERRDVPFDYGLLDWRQAGLAPDAAAVRARLPATLQWVVFHEKDPSREVLRFLPEFDRLNQSGPWDFYHRGATNADPGIRASP
ncbi:MAG: hypothetical protein HZC55_15305 [Verrucomicrobia bacterium]|nr:hypothetical protein [Verrucomicrobiota bacterium]